MKKSTVLILVIIFILSTAHAHADDPPKAYFTNSLPNGRFIDEMSNDSGKLCVNWYVIGICDTLAVTSDKLRVLYPNATHGEIFEAVKQYYKLHPLKKYRPILEVILSGCKDAPLKTPQVKTPAKIEKK